MITPGMIELDYSSVFMTSHQIIKKLHSDKKYIYGYDLFTEQFTRIEKSEASKLSPVVFKLIGDKKALILMIRTMTPEGVSSIQAATQYTGLSTRSINRLIRENELRKEDVKHLKN